MMYIHGAVQFRDEPMNVQRKPIKKGYIPSYVGTCVGRSRTCYKRLLGF